MRTTTLGAGGPQVGRIGLGCMGMSWAYGEGERDDATSIKVIHRALDLGVTLIDTADAYGPYSNEQLVGRALRGRRDQAVLATKVGLIPDGTRQLHRNARPEYIRGAIEGSLARLGVDHVDLYQLHRVDPAVPLAESWGALAELVAQGKVRAIGLSEATLAEIREAQAIHPVASVQSELSLWTRGQLDEIVPYTEEQGIAFLPFSPLGRGFLTGAITSAADLPEGDMRKQLPRFQGEAFDANQALVAKVRAVAERVGATPGQVALAWVVARGQYVVPIPGTKRLRYLEENAAAGDLELPADALAELDALPPAVGDRYGSAFAGASTGAK
ncbi:Predicted oxidoreductase [Actinopolymorpha cephalotaxi]|uniref:Predicted oxidoreductase n=1 Tax=Actinopolymorpha cephalotaxi TaxID=504797 RepID=A0A1I2USH9_9ACTN|nr:aldo/keto reductase [Actinopolymorpha cephalotaxi]NYH86644.1 aryl-alcohol dehydrogenase-like predicted oxidoreductase [Actinopolymorpha cephalotaxi]SFG77926.1 Predicted oxidoreductase [Actinopolymorpha cephalotaxi]